MGEFFEKVCMFANAFLFWRVYIGVRGNNLLLPDKKDYSIFLTFTSEKELWQQGFFFFENRFLL